MRTQRMLAGLMACLTLGGVGTVFAAGDGGRVLVAYEDTRFKKALVDEIQAALQKDGHEVVVTTHSEKGFDKGDPAGFDAVFVTNSGVRSMVRPWVVSWLEENSAHAGKIVLHTTQTKDWTVKVNDAVDAVTSASAMGDVKKLGAMYVRKLTALVPSTPPPADSTTGAADE